MIPRLPMATGAKDMHFDSRMPVSLPLSDAISKLWLPRSSLIGRVRGVMVRDTRGTALDAGRRFKHYPATPLCSLGWWSTGDVEMLEPGHAAVLESPRRAMPGRVAFSGPQTRPMVTWNTGPAYSPMLLLMPDAFRLLTGSDPGVWLDRTDASLVLPAPWLAMCAEVASADDDSRRVDLAERFLDPLWQAARPCQMVDTQRCVDWVQGLALRAATSRAGRSLRQVERHILQWTGQPLRELRGLGGAERAFFDAMAAARAPSADWASIALDNDFSDQSHLCRTSRRINGLAPAALNGGVSRCAVKRPSTSPPARAASTHRSSR